jgi:AcrR family transcriptional regulator
MRSRPYTKVRRAEAEEETRVRIVEALVALHEEVGPSRTTVSAVAAQAGVERLTVYRHFPDEGAMIRACSAHWSRLHPLPPVPDLAGVAPAAACRRVLLPLYAWYRENQRMLTQITSDIERVAIIADVFRDPLDEYLSTLADALDRTWPRRNARRRTTLRHALELTTWRSLDRLTYDDRRAVAIVAEWVGAKRG